jgi:hypothetical protein
MAQDGYRSTSTPTESGSLIVITSVEAVVSIFKDPLILKSGLFFIGMKCNNRRYFHFINLYYKIWNIMKIDALTNLFPAPQLM